jgi:hypothetical protein
MTIILTGIVLFIVNTVDKKSSRSFFRLLAPEEDLMPLGQSDYNQRFRALLAT